MKLVSLFFIVLFLSMFFFAVLPMVSADHCKGSIESGEEGKDGYRKFFDNCVEGGKNLKCVNENTAEFHNCDTKFIAITKGDGSIVSGIECVIDKNSISKVDCSKMSKEPFCLRGIAYGKDKLMSYSGKCSTSKINGCDQTVEVCEFVCAELVNPKDPLDHKVKCLSKEEYDKYLKERQEQLDTESRERLTFDLLNTNPFLFKILLSVFLVALAFVIYFYLKQKKKRSKKK